MNVKITQTSVKNAKIVDVDFAKGTSKAIKNAYRISYNQETGVMTLTLVNPASLVLDKNTRLHLKQNVKSRWKILPEELLNLM